MELIAEVAGYHFKSGYDKDILLGLVRSAATVGADAVEIMHREEEINNRMEKDIREAFPHMPIVLGGGTDILSAKSRMRNADAVLVGKCFEDGKWGGRINEATVAKYMEQINSL